MDEDRRIRFLIPPLLFIASLLLGALSNPSAHHSIVQVLTNPDGSKWIGLVVGAITGGGIVVVAAGYLIGTWSYFWLRLFFRWSSNDLFRWSANDRRKSQFHEVAMSDDAYNKVLEALNITEPEKLDRNHELYVGAAFDYDVLRKNHKEFIKGCSAVGMRSTWRQIPTGHWYSHV